MTPDWMPGVVPRCVPLEIKNNQHGERATTIVVGTERVKRAASGERSRCWLAQYLAFDLEQITSARRGYEDWWLALTGAGWADRWRDAAAWR